MNGGVACDGRGTHADVLKSPYIWMQQNPNQVIPLNVHGNNQYDKVVQDCLMKLEQAQQKRKEEAKQN